MCLVVVVYFFKNQNKHLFVDNQNMIRQNLNFKYLIINKSCYDLLVLDIKFKCKKSL